MYMIVPEILETISNHLTTYAITGQRSSCAHYAIWMIIYVTITNMVINPIRLTFGGWDSIEYIDLIFALSSKTWIIWRFALFF